MPIHSCISNTSPDAPPKPPRSPRIQRGVFGRRNPPPPPLAQGSPAKKQSPPPLPPNKPSYLPSTRHSVNGASNEVHTPPVNTREGSIGHYADSRSPEVIQANQRSISNIGDRFHGEADVVQGWNFADDPETLSDCIMSGDFNSSNAQTSGKKHGVDHKVSGDESSGLLSNEKSFHDTSLLHHSYMNSQSIQNSTYQNDMFDLQSMPSSTTKSSIEPIKPINCDPLTSSINNHNGSTTIEVFAGLSVSNNSNSNGEEFRDIFKNSNGDMSGANDPFKGCSNGDMFNNNNCPMSESEELLRAEWNEALQYTTDLKRSVADLARQEEEAYREVRGKVNTGVHFGEH